MATTVRDTMLDDITARLVRHIAPERLVLFGSRARGDHRPDSDYDILLVVGDDVDSEAARSEAYRAIRGCGRHADIVVSTATDHERRRHDVGTLEHAADVEGRVLYERVPGRTPPRERERPGLPESFAEWVGRAERDYLTMRKLADDERVTDTMAFHAHQSAEKYLKVLLIYNAIRPPRTHVLERILALCPAKIADDRAARDACALLDDIWPLTRYPSKPAPTPEQAAGATLAAEVIRGIVRTRMALGMAPS